VTVESLADEAFGFRQRPAAPNLQIIFDFLQAPGSGFAAVDESRIGDLPQHRSDILVAEETEHTSASKEAGETR